MKKITALTLATLVFSSVSFAQSPIFTTLTSSGKSVFAGVKLQEKGMEPDTYILEVSGDQLASKKIPLPAEIMHREVVGLFPAEGNQIVVLSQRTVEQGDKPLFHSYNPAKKEWKKIAEADCVSFAKLKVEVSSVTFTCVETDKKGDEVEVAKKVALSGIKLKPTGEISLPMKKVEQNSLKAELLGEAFEWKELKVGFNKKEKVFTP